MAHSPAQSRIDGLYVECSWQYFDRSNPFVHNIFWITLYHLMSTVHVDISHHIIYIYIHGKVPPMELEGITSTYINVFIYIYIYIYVYIYIYITYIYIWISCGYIFITLILPTDAVCCPDINIENVVLSCVVQYMIGDIAENTAYTQCFLV